jgi:hypothetical protein
MSNENPIRNFSAPRRGPQKNLTPSFRTCALCNEMLQQAGRNPPDLESLRRSVPVKEDKQFSTYGNF